MNVRMVDTHQSDVMRQNHDVVLTLGVFHLRSSIKLCGVGEFLCPRLASLGVFICEDVAWLYRDVRLSRQSSDRGSRAIGVPGDQSILGRISSWRGNSLLRR